MKIQRKVFILGTLGVIIAGVGAGYFIYPGNLIVTPVLRQAQTFGSETQARRDGEPSRTSDIGEKKVQAASFDTSRLPPKPSDLALAKYYDDGIKYENAILKSPQDFEAYLSAGLAWKSLGDLTNELIWYDFSADAYRRATENFDASATHYVFWLNLSNVKALAKKYNEAESAYRDGLRNFPQEAQLYLALAELYRYRLMKPQSDVIKVYEDALSNIPAKEKILQFYAPYLKEIGNYKEALFYFEQLAKVYPNETLYKQEISALKEKAL